MYLEDNIETLRGEYFALVNDIVRAAPSCIGIVDEINNDILTGSLYKALKAAKKLVQYERELLSNASARRDGLPTGG
jgi:flagellar protein FlbT